MDIDRHVERLRPLENAPETLLVEKGPRRQTVDQRALEAMTRDHALELVRCGLGIDRGQLGKAREP